ncbi:hypothetical protein ACP4OV_011838 [Aristida adscensionis]
MGDLVASALVQEGVSGVSSYISRMFNDKAPTSHMLARLEMALSQLEFALERTRKMPITYVSLLRRRKVLKCAYLEGTYLLNKHKVQSVKAHKETGKLVTGFPFLGRVIVNAKVSISSLVGITNNDCLTSSTLQYFEWYADCAMKFIADVELGNPLQHNSFCHPLVRQLLEEKVLGYEMVKESRACFLYIWPVYLEGRGVEAQLIYKYLDMERPEQCFDLGMMLRLSDDVDIIGVTIKCLWLLTSWFKLVTESAIGELTIVSCLPKISTMDAPPMHWIENYADFTKLLRPDPICCTNDTILSEVSLGVPQSVIAIHFEFMLHSSIDGVGRKAPPLHLHVAFSPHTCTAQQGFVLKYGAQEECIGGSILQMEDILRLKVVQYVLHQPEPMYYSVSWYSAHGVAFIILHKPSNQQAYPKLTAARRPRRIILEYGGNKERTSGSIELTDEQMQKSKSLDCVVGQLEPMHYAVKWYYRNFDAQIPLHGSSKELGCPKPMAGAKRKR